MKIAIFGTTLHAGVMAVLLSEYGNSVFWVRQSLDPRCSDSPPVYHDQEVNQRIQKQSDLKCLNLISMVNLPSDIDAYVFCFSPKAMEQALETLKHLRQKNALPKLMINGSTFGLHGTAHLKVHFPCNSWVYLPDIVQEGNAFASFLSLQHLMVGIETSESKEIIEELFRPFFPFKNQYLFMPILDAEFTKLSISGMLATRISYMNDMAIVAEKLGIDIANVRQGMSADTRIGPAYLSPGVGFGGENFSHDILTLSGEVSKSGIKSRLLEQVWEINEQQKELLFRKLWTYYHADLKNKVVAIWGASFKENSSSTQNSPIHMMLQALWAQGVQVKLHDPQALPEIYQLYGDREDLILSSDAYEIAKDADALCILTAWKQYYSPDYYRLQQVMRHRFILDGRNIYDPGYVKSLGFEYEGVGR